jgi:acyl carrier protein
MVPASYVHVDRLPRTPSGKLDRRALGNLEGEPEEPVDGAEPRTVLEAFLAAVWADVLDREEVGVTDNFFELGGHSLTAVQMTGRVREVLGWAVPPRMVFEAPTVEQMSRVLEEEVDHQRMEEAVALFFDVRNMDEGEIPTMSARQSTAMEGSPERET